MRDTKIMEKNESERGQEPNKDDGSDMFETNRSRDRKLASTLQPGVNKNDNENDRSVDALIRSQDNDGSKE